MYRFLLTDRTFKELNIPIPAAVIREMSDRTRKNGRLEDIYTWNGYILTGYEQDELCLTVSSVIAGSADNVFLYKNGEFVASYETVSGVEIGTDRICDYVYVRGGGDNRDWTVYNGGILAIGSGGRSENGIHHGTFHTKRSAG